MEAWSPRLGIHRGQCRPFCKQQQKRTQSHFGKNRNSGVHETEEMKLANVRYSWIHSPRQCSQASPGTPSSLPRSHPPSSTFLMLLVELPGRPLIGSRVHLEPITGNLGHSSSDWPGRGATSTPGTRGGLSMWPEPGVGVAA